MTVKGRPKLYPRGRKESVPLRLWIDEATSQALIRAAKKSGQSVSGAVRSLIRAGLGLR
jgi:hypothetical protein